MKDNLPGMVTPLVLNVNKVQVKFDSFDSLAD